MAVRRTHYETAFQAYLDRRGTPYVAVEDVRHAVAGRTGIKSFDYIVYPAGGSPWLIDVKGRKSKAPKSGGEWRQKNWVTGSDLKGLAAWGELFGEEYDGAFVFAYWLAGAVRPLDTAAADSQWVSFAGRVYSFWLVRLQDYIRHQKPISARWGTVGVPRDAFRSIADPLETCWPAAPC